MYLFSLQTHAHIEAVNKEIGRSDNSDEVGHGDDNEAYDDSDKVCRGDDDTTTAMKQALRQQRCWSRRRIYGDADVHGNTSSQE
jgi:hypothetical protein